jgi:uncharacterized protein YlxW (UPF0749 family)
MTKSSSEIPVTAGPVEQISIKLTELMGTPASIVVHTFLFIGAFSLYFVGIEINTILLVLTTMVSLEAIYLSLFIQMTVNRNTESLEDVGEDIEEIQEDVAGVEGDIDRIQEDVEDLGEEVEDISEDMDKIQEEETESDSVDVTQIDKLKRDINLLKAKK